jgi:hypothetical protein
MAEALGLEQLRSAVTDEADGTYITLPEMVALLLMSARFEPSASDSDAEATRRICRFAQFQSVHSALHVNREIRDSLNKELAQFANVLPEQLQPLSMMRFLPALDYQLVGKGAVFTFLPPYCSAAPIKNGSSCK